mmetsp:Transcript_2022/g.4752  ORF Transcript_2022/g.4752 Transcript_2022/m.4752 type:complete len:252 (+) Transcript_2022:1619-2374(+)
MLCRFLQCRRWCHFVHHDTTQNRSEGAEVERLGNNPLGNHGKKNRPQIPRQKGQVEKCRLGKDEKARRANVAAHGHSDKGKEQEKPRLQGALAVVFETSLCGKESPNVVTFEPERLEYGNHKTAGSQHAQILYCATSLAHGHLGQDVVETVQDASGNGAQISPQLVWIFLFFIGIGIGFVVLKDVQNDTHHTNEGTNVMQGTISSTGSKDDASRNEHGSRNGQRVKEGDGRQCRIPKCQHCNSIGFDVKKG